MCLVEWGFKFYNGEIIENCWRQKVKKYMKKKIIKFQREDVSTGNVMLFIQHDTIFYVYNLLVETYFLG